MYCHDSELIQACLQDDESAWMELVNRYTRLVYSIPRRLGFSLDDAEDVFQNVFVIVFRRLDTLRDQKLIAAWIINITNRECYRLRAHSPNHAEMPETLVDPEESPPDQVEVLERQHLVRLALDQLEPRCRDLLSALFLEEPTPKYDKVAARLRMREGSIGPTRARCFKKLEEILIEMGVNLNS